MTSMKPRVFAILLVLSIMAPLTANPAWSQETGSTIDYVGSEVCGSCHAAEFTAWADSHHGWALREAEEDNVLGRFDDEVLQFDEVTARFFLDDGKYYVETDGPDGEPSVHQVRYTVGVTPLQQFLVETEGGRLQALDIAWDTVDERWYHLYPDDILGSDEGLHWTGPYKNWQARCAVCHQTNFQKDYDAQSKTYQTTRNDRSSEPSCRLLPSMPEAFDDLRMSVDRFCLLAGLESLNEMMSADAPGRN